MDMANMRSRWYLCDTTATFKARTMKSYVQALKVYEQKGPVEVRTRIVHARFEVL